MYRKLRESSSAFFQNNSSHGFLKTLVFDEDRTCLVEVAHSQSFSWPTCIFSIFCVPSIIFAVRLEMTRKSSIHTVLNGHKTIGPRNFWDVEQID